MSIANQLLNKPMDKALSDGTIVIGSGPVGIYFVNELIKRAPDSVVTVFGGEPWQPYNRVRLTDVLSGKTAQGSLFDSEKLPNYSNITEYWNNPIVEINHQLNYVVDSYGVRHFYSDLVLALGSNPRVPEIKGVDLENVFTFRNLDEAQALIGRQVSSRKTVVIGGGLLGIEAAKAMQRFNTDVVCIEHSTRLMFNQLDDTASGYLESYLKEKNIQSIINQRVLEILPDEYSQSKVSGVLLASREIIECDTVIISTGIIPNINIARKAGISVGRGIKIDNNLKTNAESVYAIGECAEHKEKIYGLAAPGFEQASILAENLSGSEAQYGGSTSISQLKVLDFPVFSMGNVAEGALGGKAFIYSDSKNNIYRKLVVNNNRLTGVIALGDWPARHRIQDAIENKRYIWFWKPFAFRSSGELWDEEENNIVNWPAEAIVCNCMSVTRGQLSRSINKGNQTLEKLCKATGASSVCGSCKPLLQQLTESNDEVIPEKGAGLLWGASLIGLLALLVFLLAPSMPYSESVQSPLANLDSLWRVTFYKQISGFFLLGLSIVVLLMSLRKRILKFSWGEFPNWRVVHVVLGVLCLAAIFIHTGFRTGSNLNFILMMTFAALLFVGVIASAVIAQEHQLSKKLSQRFLLRIRKMSILTHIFLFWPIPALLAFHIIKSYYF